MYLMMLVITSNINKNIIEIYNNNSGNNSSNSKNFEFINFFINNRSSHSKQLTKVIKII